MEGAAKNKVIKLRIELDCVYNVGENATDGGTKQGQDDDHDDSDQHEDQCVFYEALAFFFGGE